jgi:uncharacterized Zn-binding protein involved in type VI secretion
MFNRLLIIAIAFVICLIGNNLAQDESTLMEMVETAKKLIQEYENCQDPIKKEQLMNEYIELEEEMNSLAEKIQNLGESQNQGYESIQTNDPAIERIIKQQQEYVNSLPPTLQKIQRLSNEIDKLDDDLTANCEKINATSIEILQLMGKLYLSENETPSNLSSLITSLKFCKEITINYELKGKGHNSDIFEINYNITMQLKSYWTLVYHVDVIQRKGYLNSYTITSVKNETYPDKITDIDFSGRFSNKPLSYYSYNPGTGSIIIGPSELKKFDFYDSNTWPDELVSTYFIGYTPPVVLFSTSQDILKGLVLPMLCATNTNSLTYITPEELNKGIREGTYIKVITKDTFFPNCDESTITISIDFPNLLCDQHENIGALATADACIDHGGYVLATEDLVFAHGKPIARVGDEVLCLRHGITEIVGDKDVKVYSDEQRIARVGDKTKCGAIIMGGSFNVYAGDKKK